MSFGMHIYRKNIVGRYVEVAKEDVTSNIYITIRELPELKWDHPDLEEKVLIRSIRKNLEHDISFLESLPEGFVLTEGECAPWPYKNWGNNDSYQVRKRIDYILGLYRWVLSFPPKFYLVRENC